jgi:hypothetical protein
MDQRINKKINTYICDFKTQTTARLNELCEKVNRRQMMPGGGASYMHPGPVAAAASTATPTTLSEDVISDCNAILSFIYNYPTFELDKSDFVKRKRVKNVVPLCDRCCAKRANGEQCTRRKKEGDQYCGTHVKGAPHGILDETTSTMTKKKVNVWGQDIKGIVYYIDDMNNVYEPTDVLSNIENPRIIAKYVKSGDIYSIPSLFKSTSALEVM